MKKIYYVLALAAVVATAACSKDDNNGVSEEALLSGLGTDWLNEGLFGQPKKRVSNYYTNVKIDSSTRKPITPNESQLYIISTTEFSGAGFKTVETATQQGVTGATPMSNPNYVKVSTGQQLRRSITYTRDDKNRITLEDETYYSYYPAWGDNELYGNNGDSCFLYTTEGAFKLEMDTTRSKTETTYSETTATEISYDMEDGEWVESSKTVRSLNKYGFVDDNSTVERYRVKPTAFEEKPYEVDYTEVDERGNPTLYYYTYNNNYNIGSYYTYTYEY